MNSPQFRYVGLAPMLIAASCSAAPVSFDARDPHSPAHFLTALPLPGVRGRIDHMAIDPVSRHLFVAELANGSVDDVDLASGKIAGRITGLHEPQGVAWLPQRSELAVACGDGTVHFYRRSDRQELARIKLGDDADNVRVDARNGNLVVGYGSGALAVIDASTHGVIRTLQLSGHPEAFEILGSNVLVNVPDRHQVVVGDIDRAVVTRSVDTGTRFGNFPMAQDSGREIAIAFRLPSSLARIDPRPGEVAWSTAICRDADDLFFVSRLIVAVCGEGAVELVTPANRKIIVVTRRGARTGLYDPTSGRLFIAVPGHANAASIWELAIDPAAGKGE